MIQDGTVNEVAGFLFMRLRFHRKSVDYGNLLLAAVLFGLFIMIVGLMITTTIR